jgi:hypothetical protein
LARLRGLAKWGRDEASPASRPPPTRDNRVAAEVSHASKLRGRHSGAGRAISASGGDPMRATVMRGSRSVVDAGGFLQRIGRRSGLEIRCHRRQERIRRL